MALTVGTRLGPYEILAPLGAGGMGEVYHARDTRLGRDIAIKVLPQQVSASPEDRARFKREAKTISSLNHPHICVLHDVGQEGDTDFLVMELVEGETLAQRIARGALPPAEVLRIGAQIADALDRAHRAGVIHRDLKPSNVMLAKSGAKLMDFGLARDVRHGAGGADFATETEPGAPARSEESITKKGTIVGTFQYMAPELLEGKRADARSDIWALGCVLYEMATGKRAFQGSTPASIISAIMRDQPRLMAELAPLTPPALERGVKQCLAKDSDDRWQTARDLRRELDWIAEGGSQADVAAPIAARRSRERLAWALTAIAGAVAAGLAAMQLQPKPAPKSSIFELTPPPLVSSIDLPRISPDGSHLAFNATDSSGVSGIWVRPMNSLAARLLPGTKDASRPFWSPDSRYLAFFAGGKLLTIDIGGGPPVTLCDAWGVDGTWSPRGFILFDGSKVDSIQMVRASGGIPTGATRLDRTKQESSAGWPQFLPDGRHFLYISYVQDSYAGTLKVGSIDSKETKTLGPAASRAEYASGHLLYVRAGTLLAQPFDVGSLQLKGEAVPLAQNVEAMDYGNARFSTGAEGTLVYRSGGTSVSARLVWVNRRGERIGTVGEPGDYDLPALSPDGTQLAAVVTDRSRDHSEIWLWDLSRNLGSPFTFANQDASAPVWSPDGTRILYSLYRAPAFDLFVKPISGTGTESLLYASNEPKFPNCWSSDGRWITYTALPATTNATWGTYAISLGDSARPVSIAASRFAVHQSALSPDGVWVAYTSEESGQQEVYIQSFRGRGAKWRISTRGGSQAAWRGDGRELYYLAPDRALMAVTVEPGPPPRFSLPQKLFGAPVVARSYTRNFYVAARDGQRFLLVASEGETKVGTTVVVLNWLALLSKK